MDIPVLPIKVDKLYFMNGELSGTYWFEEIKLFIESGGEVLEINYAIIFDSYDNVLEGFINELEGFKKTDNVSKMVGKLLINSFYGRLGMGSETSRSFISDNDNHDEFMPYIDNLVIFKKKITHNTIGNVAIAAAITSKARIKLYKGYQAVLKRGGRLLYSDTDSIVAAFEKEKTPLDIDIGGIIFDSKKTDTKIMKAVFISSKTYSLILEDNTEITRVKGVKIDGVHFDRLEANFYNGGEITFDDQLLFSKKNHVIYIKNINKTINLSNYSKRIFTDDKKSTVPRIY